MVDSFVKLRKKNKKELRRGKASGALSSDMTTINKTVETHWVIMKAEPLLKK